MEDNSALTWPPYPSKILLKSRLSSHLFRQNRLYNEILYTVKRHSSRPGEEI